MVTCKSTEVPRAQVETCVVAFLARMTGESLSNSTVKSRRLPGTQIFDITRYFQNREWTVGMSLLASTVLLVCIAKRCGRSPFLANPDVCPGCTKALLPGNIALVHSRLLPGNIGEGSNVCPGCAELILPGNNKLRRPKGCPCW
jgi:hypothetical protein